MEYVNEFLEIRNKSENLKYIKSTYERFKENRFNEDFDLIYFFNKHITYAGPTDSIGPIKDYAKNLYSEIKDFKKGLPSELREELSSEIVGLEKLCKDFF